jgi:hypothetical protein
LPAERIDADHDEKRLVGESTFQIAGRVLGQLVLELGDARVLLNDVVRSSRRWEGDDGQDGNEEGQFT